MWTLGKSHDDSLFVSELPNSTIQKKEKAPNLTRRSAVTYIKFEPDYRCECASLSQARNYLIVIPDSTH